MYVWFPPTFRQPFALRFFFLSFSLLLWGERGVDIFSFCAFLPFSSRIKKNLPTDFTYKWRSCIHLLIFVSVAQFSSVLRIEFATGMCHVYSAVKKKQTKQTLIVIISWNGFILSQRLHTVFPAPFVSFKFREPMSRVSILSPGN